MNNFLRRSHKLGVFLAVFFIGCYLWYWIHPVQQEFHMKFLQSAFFGFTGMDFRSFAWGVVGGYVYGYVFTALWDISNFIARGFRN